MMSNSPVASSSRYTCAESETLPAHHPSNDFLEFPRQAHDEHHTLPGRNRRTKGSVKMCCWAQAASPCVEVVRGPQDDDSRPAAQRA